MNYMTLLAHRAGHIWDTTVVAKSPNSRLDNGSAAVIDSQISYFLANDLPTLHIPHTGGLEKHSYNKTAMVLSNNNITLLLRHREMTCLQYDGNSAQEFGSLALDSMSHLRGFMDKAVGPAFSVQHRSFRHHIVSSISGSLLIFCALLVRDLSAPELDLQHNYSAYLKGFQDGFAMLESLRSRSSYARRVLEDFESIRSVVAAVIQELTPDGQMQGGFPSVEALVPPNVAELFPYRALTPSLQANTLSSGEAHPARLDPLVWDSVEASVSGGGVLWL